MGGNMQAVCPITDKRINENVSRLNALVTVLFVAAFLVFNFWGGIVFMMVDFALRGFIDSKYSIVCQMNKWIVSKINLSPKLMNAGPKMFAAQFGLVFTAFILLGLLFDMRIISQVVAIVLGVFSFMESAFGFCVACQLYPFLRKK